LLSWAVAGLLLFRLRNTNGVGVPIGGGRVSSSVARQGKGGGGEGGLEIDLLVSAADVSALLRWPAKIKQKRRNEILLQHVEIESANLKKNLATTRLGISAEKSLNVQFYE
jgi:hypothetical protein